MRLSVTGRMTLSKGPELEENSVDDVGEKIEVVETRFNNESSRLRSESEELKPLAELDIEELELEVNEVPISFG